MDRLVELTLVIGLIFVSAYSMKTNQDAIRAINEMNKQIQMMFIRS